MLLYQKNIYFAISDCWILFNFSVGILLKLDKLALFVQKIQAWGLDFMKIIIAILFLFLLLTFQVGFRKIHNPHFNMFLLAVI